jgi:beta-galactosidase/beta-glucuronidase
MENHEQPVGKQWGWYTTTSGIWQTVYLEPRSLSHIDCFRIHPDIDHGRVAFEVECKETLADFSLTVDIAPPASPSFSISLDLHDGVALGDAEIHPVLLWEPGDPKLYRVTFRLWDSLGQAVDTVRSYFGMRKISTAPADDAPAMLCLNNKPIYLRGALYQSYYPDGVYTAMDARMLLDDISYAISMGFDFLRIHLKIDDPMLLYYADTLGMLLMQDFPNFGEGGDTPTGRRRFQEMMVEAMRRDYNHPSIISWCIFNETWGFGGQNELMKVITPDLRPSTLQEEGVLLANSARCQQRLQSAVWSWRW